MKYQVKATELIECGDGNKAGDEVIGPWQAKLNQVHPN